MAKPIGNVMSVPEVTVTRGESLIAESGNLSWMTESIQLRTSTRMAGATGIFGTLKRIAAGGRLRRADSGHDTGLPAPLFDQCDFLSAGSSHIAGNPRIGGLGRRYK
ncbi:MAG: AIM24 family protein [Mycobacterium sp.]